MSILRSRLQTNIVPGEHPHLTAVRAQLADYFSGKNLEFSVPLAPVGSPFQTRTWDLLRKIPVGETRSYSWMATKLGDAGMRRAVGRANGDNMLCLIIPCHRVIRPTERSAVTAAAYGARNGARSRAEVEGE